MDSEEVAVLAIVLVAIGLMVGFGAYAFHLNGVQYDIDQKLVSDNFVIYTDNHTMVLSNLGNVDDEMESFLFWKAVENYRLQGWELGQIKTIEDGVSDQKLQVIFTR